MAEENGQEQSVDLSSLGSFDFAPSWAAGDKVVAKAGRGGFRDDSEEQHRSRDDRPQQRRFDGPKPAGNRALGNGDRPKKQFNRDDRQRKPFGGGRGGRDGDRQGFRREFVKPLDAEVRILPGQKELGGIIRKIQTGFAAYPLKQIAWFFLDHPEACHVKVTPKDSEMRFHVCKSCGQSFFAPESLDAHILSAHLGDYYTSEEIEVEPPSGQFACVVKCGITGELLGPPNLHATGAAIREMSQRLGMSEGAYRDRLVTLHDQDAVETWRKGATKKTVYRLKTDGPKDGDDPAATMPTLERDQAEAEFRRNILPQLKSISKSSDMPLDQALKSTDRPYLYAVRDAMARERRFPASLFFALRGAFHHRKLEFFRANEPRGQEFVCAAKPSPLDVEHAIPELGVVVKFVTEHPLCSVGDLPPEMAGHLGWLVEKGHIIQYFNGLLALPEAHPKFIGKPQKKELPVTSAAEEPKAAPAEEVLEEKKEEISNEAADQLAE